METTVINAPNEQDEKVTVVPEEDFLTYEVPSNDYLDRVLRQVLNIEGAR